MQKKQHVFFLLLLLLLFFKAHFILGDRRATNVIVIDVIGVNLMKIMQIVTIQVKVTQFVCLKKKKKRQQSCTSAPPERVVLYSPKQRRTTLKKKEKKEKPRTVCLSTY